MTKVKIRYLSEPRMKRALGEKAYAEALAKYESTPGGKGGFFNPTQKEIEVFKAVQSNKIHIFEYSKKLGFKNVALAQRHYGRMAFALAEVK